MSPGIALADHHRLVRGCSIALLLALTACASSPERPAPPPVPAPDASPTDAGSAAAPSAAVNPYSGCRGRVLDNEILLDETRRRVQETVCGAAFWFDGLFGDKGDIAAARSSYGRVELSTEYSQFSGSTTRLRFQAQVSLPALENRLSAFVGLDNEDDFVRDRSQGRLRTRTPRQIDRDEFLAGLGFATLTTERFQSDFRVGVRNIRLPKIFVQNRFSYIAYSDEQYRLLLRSTPFWNNRDGFGLTSSMDLDRALKQDFLLRWASAATLTQETEGLDWRTALILYQNLRGARALAHEGFIRGTTGAAEPLAEYGVRSIYRHPFLQERLFGELILGYSWPRIDPTLPREGSYLIGLGVEMPFGTRPEAR